MAKAKAKTSSTKAPKAPKAPATKAPRVKPLGPPEICACDGTVKLERSKDGDFTGQSVCKGRVVCSKPSKRLDRAYTVPKPNYRVEREPPAGSYTTKTEPCQTGRKGCPVQLFFRDNKPFVRFCGKAREITKVDRKTGETRTARVGAGMPGWIVPVETASKARRLVAAACKQWNKAGGEFTDQNVAVRFAKAARAGSGPDQALGRAR